MLRVSLQAVGRFHVRQPSADSVDRTHLSPVNAVDGTVWRLYFLAADAIAPKADRVWTFLARASRCALPVAHFMFRANVAGGSTDWFPRNQLETLVLPNLI